MNLFIGVITMTNETFGFYAIIYKKDTKSVRDQLPDTTSQNIIKQLQQQINQLVTYRYSRKQPLWNYRVIKLEDII